MGRLQESLGSRRGGHQARGGTCYTLWLAIFYSWRNSIWLQA